MKEQENSASFGNANGSRVASNRWQAIGAACQKLLICRKSFQGQGKMCSLQDGAHLGL